MTSLIRAKEIFYANGLDCIISSLECLFALIVGFENFRKVHTFQCANHVVHYCLVVLTHRPKYLLCSNISLYD